MPKEKQRLDKVITRWRAAIFSIFVVDGLVIGALFSRMPAIREELSGSTSTIGIVLFFMSIGSTTGLVLSPIFLKKFGAKVSLTMLTAALGLTLFIIGTLSSVFASMIGICIVGILEGIALGASDVQINVEGTLIEKRMGRSLLPFLHAGFSIGSVLGSTIGSLSEAIHLNMMTHLGIVAIIIISVAIFIYPRIPAKDFQRVEGKPATEARGFSLKTYKNGALLLIGIMLLGIAIAEGGANDWLGIAMVDGHHESKSNGALLLTLLLTVITLVRLFGSKLIDKFGNIVVIRVTMVIAVIGLAIFILGNNWFFYITGAVLWGIGVSLGFPICMSLAAAGSSDSAARVTAVSIIGYLAFLGGPPTLGFIAEHIGILNTLWILASFCAIALVVSFWVKDRTKFAPDTTTNQIIIPDHPAGML